MTKIRSKVIVNKNQETLVNLREEYISLGFHTSLEKGVLTVYSRKPKAKRKDK